MSRIFKYVKVALSTHYIINKKNENINFNYFGIAVK
jgi:hypothetical protein